MPYFSYEDRRIYFEEEGSGIPIVFIHPPAMGRKVFYYQTRLGKNFRVIFPDLSGHGDSMGAMEEVSILGFAKEIEQLLNHLGIEKAVICGYSCGGLVAQEFALSFSDRILALMLAGGYPEVQSAGFKYEHIAGMYLVKHFPSLLAHLIASSHTNNEKLKQEIYDHMGKADKDVWFQFYEKSLDYSCEERLHQLNVPLLLMYGSRDFINQHLRSYRKYTDHHMAIIKKVSHQIPTKKWKIFNQIITGFLLESL